MAAQSDFTESLNTQTLLLIQITHLSFKELLLFLINCFFFLQDPDLHRGRLGVLNIIASLLFEWPGAAKETSTQYQQPYRHPPDVERSSHSVFFIVGFMSYGDCGPADWYEHQDTCNDEGNSRNKGLFSLLPFILIIGGAVAPYHTKHDAKNIDDDGHDGEHSGSLQFLRYIQRNISFTCCPVVIVIVLTLTVLPQTQPIIPSKFPSGADADGHASKRAEDGKDQTQKLPSTSLHYNDFLAYS